MLRKKKPGRAQTSAKQLISLPVGSYTVCVCACVCFYVCKFKSFDPGLESSKIKDQSPFSHLNITKIELSLPRPMIILSRECKQTRNF